MRGAPVRDARPTTQFGGNIDKTLQRGKSYVGETAFVGSVRKQSVARLI